MGTHTKSSAVPSVWREHDAKVKPYLWRHRGLRWTKSLFGLAVMAGLLLPPRGRALEAWLAPRFTSLFGLWLGYFGLLAGAWSVLSFPFDLGHQLIEKRYGLSKQSFGSWLWDKVKALMLGAVLGSIIMGLLYVSVSFFPGAWWAVACTLFVIFSIVLAQLTPVLLIPLFFKLKPMEDSSLKERLLGLCRKFEVEVKDVYHLGLGEKTEKGNAAFVGLGRTKRIIIGDTLYEKYSPDEVEAVFAHELGHQVHNDLWKGIGLSASLIYVSFFFAQALTATYLLGYFQTGFERPFGLLLFFTVLSLVQLPIGVLQAIYSRSREHQADEFALGRIGVGAPLADALEKLTFQNFGQFLPNTILEFLTYSHPSPWRRILWLRARERQA